MKRTLADWLAWQEQLHPQAIDLGLDRVAAVARRLDVLRPAPVVISVAGTNGKGSTVAMLESILRTSGRRVGAYTSPHLIRYNERIRIDGREASDDELCAAFERIDAARGDISLTYFEFGTLAALDLMRCAPLDVALLEVGMGGRLDAVNVVDADCAIVTSIGLDHQQWLGDDREAIGREKAGIFRTGRPAVCADPDPPASLVAAARECAAALYLPDRDFRAVSREDGLWDWRCGDAAIEGLPPPALAGGFQLRNAAAAITALHLSCLGQPHRAKTPTGAAKAAIDGRQELPFAAAAAPTGIPFCGDARLAAAVPEGLAGVSLPGRFQRLAERPEIIADVAHNPDSAAALAALLAEHPTPGRSIAVFAVLADKDLDGIVAPLAGCFSAWHVAGLPGVARAEVPEPLAVRLALRVGVPVTPHADVAAALVAAREQACLADRVIVFGSFHTVGAAMASLQADRQRR